MVICHIGPDNAMLKYLQKNLIQWVKVAIEIELAYAINVKQIVQFHNLTFFANKKMCRLNDLL